MKVSEKHFRPCGSIYDAVRWSVETPINLLPRTFRHIQTYLTGFFFQWHGYLRCTDGISYFFNLILEVRYFCNEGKKLQITISNYLQIPQTRWWETLITDEFTRSLKQSKQLSANRARNATWHKENRQHFKTNKGPTYKLKVRDTTNTF